MYENKAHLSFRLTDEDLNLLRLVCKARGETPSTFLRRAMKREFARLSYLSPAEKKALEVTTKEVTYG